MTAAGGAADMRKLAAFIALSLGVHLLLVLTGVLRLPDFRFSPELPPLTARLVPLQPQKPLTPMPKPAAPATTTSSSTPVFTAPTGIADPAASNAPAAEVTSSGTTLPPVTRTLPHAGELRYTLFLGAEEFGKQPPSGRDASRRDGLFTVGRTVQQWQIDGAGHYTLSSVSETTGLISLFARRRYVYQSRGTVTAEGGMRPETFNAERKQRGTTERASAQFDWATQRATFGVPPQHAALSATTQDLMSFIYQLGLMPLQPGRLSLPVSNGWKLETYELDIGAAEIIDTPLGKLNAIPVRQIRTPGKESIAVWLATEYRMLPVRIRFFDRDGKAAGEQLITDIQVSPE
jgi:hypothetical protein